MSEEPWRWRPEPWWLAAGLFFGAVAGMFIGAAWGALIFLLPGEPLIGVVVGGALGVPYGAMVGLTVGCVLALVVGRDRPVRSARRVATWAGLVTTPLVVSAFFTVQGLGLNTWVLPLLVMAAVAGALACRWTAGKMPHRPRVVSPA